MGKEGGKDGGMGEMEGCEERDIHCVRSTLTAKQLNRSTTDMTQ